MLKISKVLFLLIAGILIIQIGCKKDEPSQNGQIANGFDESTVARGAHTQTYSGDVANEWMKMQIRVMATASGIPNVAFCRPYAYSSIALYEAVIPGMRSYKSLVGQLTGLPAMPSTNHHLRYHWASSANAAMASILKSMYPTTSTANLFSIDSLENVFNVLYSAGNDTATINRSVAFGRAVALTVFNWSATDNSNHASDPYTAPIGPGKWIPTPPGFAAASTPYWGNLRLLVPGSGNNSQPPAPIPYSEVPGSAFYQMAKQVYDVSLVLNSQQTAMALYWRDIPGVSTPGHYISILEQVLESTHLALDKAAEAYVLSGITVYDAAVSTWKTKYDVSLIRPISYIRNVLGYTSWNSLLTTPAHPEYSSAHAVLSAANAEVLESIFGTHFHFTDHTYDYLGMAPRSFNSFRACGEDAANSRLYAGIHYQRSIDKGLIQGRKIARNILDRIELKKSNCDHNNDDDDD